MHVFAKSWLAGLVLLLLSPGAGVSSSEPHFGEPCLGDTRVRPSDGMVMVYVPAGEFEMGTTEAGVRAARQLCSVVCGPLAVAVCQSSAFSDERPAHRVSVSAFWIDRVEVTNAQYARCVKAGSCAPPRQLGSYTRASYYDDPNCADYPVIWITWEQATEYAAWAGVRLASEAEWEYAARGPASFAFPWGDAFDGTRVNYCAAECAAGLRDATVCDGFADTAPVASFPSGVSWCGAFDLAGNVREWVADVYGLYEGSREVVPQGLASGDAHIAKGGSWLDRPDDVRSANRGANALGYCEHKVGFRCAVGAQP